MTPSFPQTDKFGFEILMPRGNAAAVILRTLIIDQLIALPVALVMTSVGGNFVTMLIITTVYSQLIGLLCAMTSLLTIEWLDGQTPWRGQAGVMAQYFACGVVGAELARRVCALFFGSELHSGPPLVSWAIGATVALLVGGVLTTMRQLRGRVLSTELEALQARINPHFLFNTLNSIAALLRVDPARASAMILQLSALFPYT